MCPVLLLHSTLPPDASFFDFRRLSLLWSPLLPSSLPLALHLRLQCAPHSHTRAVTPLSPRLKRKSTPTNSSPSSGTRIQPCSTRRTSEYSSGSTSRACWMRRTREPSSSPAMLWSAFGGLRTGGGPWGQPQGHRGE